MSIFWYFANGWNKCVFRTGNWSDNQYQQKQSFFVGILFFVLQQRFQKSIFLFLQLEHPFVQGSFLII